MLDLICRYGIRTEVVRENIKKALDALKKELVKICPQFDGYEMQDAHEFLISLLDAIKEEQTPKNPEGNPDEIPKVEEDPAEEVQVWSQIACLEHIGTSSQRMRKTKEFSKTNFY